MTRIMQLSAKCFHMCVCLAASSRKSTQVHASHLKNDASCLWVGYFKTARRGYQFYRDLWLCLKTRKIYIEILEFAIRLAFQFGMVSSCMDDFNGKDKQIGGDNLFGMSDCCVKILGFWRRCCKTINTVADDLF